MFYIRCEPDPKKRVYRLIEIVIIEGVHCPKGFEWDGASVPGFLWPVIGSPFDPRFMAPALVHDRLYSTGELPRKKADKIFKKLLLANGVPDETAETMYSGVDWFGKSHYNERVVAV